MPRKSDDRGRRDKMAMEPTIPSASVRRKMPDMLTEPRVVEPRSGGSTRWVVVALVAAVAVAFWGLSERGPRKADAPAPGSETTATPASAPAAAPASPPRSTSRKEKPATAPAPATTPPATPSGSARAAGAPTAAPAEAAPPSVAAMPVHKRPHQKKKKKPKAAKLPRLPSPPPPDNRP
jgi:hypothetical protein